MRRAEIPSRQVNKSKRGAMNFHCSSLCISKTTRLSCGSVPLADKRERGFCDAKQTVGCVFLARGRVHRLKRKMREHGCVFSSLAGERPAAASAGSMPVFHPKNPMAPAVEGARTRPQQDGGRARVRHSGFNKTGRLPNARPRPFQPPLGALPLVHRR